MDHIIYQIDLEVISTQNLLASPRNRFKFEQYLLYILAWNYILLADSGLVIPRMFQPISKMQFTKLKINPLNI